MKQIKKTAGFVVVRFIASSQRGEGSGIILFVLAIILMIIVQYCREH